MSDEAQDDVKAIATLIAVLKPLDPQARLHILEFVLKRLGIPLTAGQAAPAHGTGIADITPATPSAATAAPLGQIDIRTFAAEKKPRTVNEKVAVVAFYLAHLAPQSERRDRIVSDDIKPFFVQADFPLPTAPPNMTLMHAKNAGYLNALDRGQYRLNAVGYNLVAHKLPSGEPGERKRKTAKRPAKKTRRPVKKKVRAKGKK